MAITIQRAFPVKGIKNSMKMYLHEMKKTIFHLMLYSRYINYTYKCFSLFSINIIEINKLKGFQNVFTKINEYFI